MYDSTSFTCSDDTHPKVRRSGGRRYCSTCARQRNKESVQAHRANKRQFMQDLKLWLGCADCGFRGHPEALQFDHISGIKIFSPSAGATTSWSKLFAELDKCEVVCANCHAIRTHSRR